MNLFILKNTGRILFPCLLVLSLVVLYRGHNLPGGGFIGGLIGATAFILLGLGESMAYAKKMLRINPVPLQAIGLAVAVLSGLPGLFMKGAFLTGVWLPDFYLPLLGKVHLGTPLVFDIGVYLAVCGFVLYTTFSLSSLAQVKEEAS